MATTDIAAKRLKRSKGHKLYKANANTEKFALQRPGSKTYGITGGVVSPPVKVR